MPSHNKLEWREFNETLKKYRELHKRRTTIELTNKKALFIARGAIRETFRPTKETIEESLFAMGNTADAPIAALIINKRRGVNRQPGLSGDFMRVAIDTLVKIRKSARTFLAAGWIPSVKKLGSLVGNKRGIPPNDPDANRIKNPKGSVMPARNVGFKTIATIINSASAKKTNSQDALDKHAVAGLQKAIDKERQSMVDNIKEEMLKAAKECGIKAH